jgi:hypothetical protein
MLRFQSFENWTKERSGMGKHIYTTHTLYDVKKGKAPPVPGSEGPQNCDMSRHVHFLDNRLTDGGEVVAIMRRPQFTTEKIPGTHFCQKMSQRRVNNGAGTKRLIKKSNDVIGNRSRDLLNSSTAHALCGRVNCCQSFGGTWGLHLHAGHTSTSATKHRQSYLITGAESKGCGSEGSTFDCLLECSIE